MTLFQCGPEFAEEVAICRLLTELPHLDLTKPAIITQEALKLQLTKGVSEALSAEIASTCKSAADEFKQKGAHFRVTKPIDSKDAEPLSAWMQAVFPEGFKTFDNMEGQVLNAELASLLVPQAFFSTPGGTFCQA